MRLQRSTVPAVRAQEVTMPNARLQRIVFGERGERAARIQARVGAELAHMTRRHVDLRVTVHAASRQRA